MNKKKVLLVVAIALLGVCNLYIAFADIPPVNIICDQPQEGQGRCFEEVPGFPGDCRWTGYTDDYC